MKNRLSAIIRRHSLTHRPLLAIAWTVCVVASPSASAADGSWNANAAGGWQDPANWLGGVIPDGVGDSAAFSLDINANRTISLNGDRTLGSLTIGDPTSGFSNFTLAAGTPGNSRLIFDQGAGATATLSYPVVSSTANNSLSVPVLLMGNLSITTEQTTTGNQTLSGIIADGAGSYGLSKSGPGILTLSALNNYKGGTTVNAGKVNANTFAALGSGAVGVSSGGQVHLAATNGAYRNAFTIAGTGFGITETNNTHLLGALRYANSLTSGSISVASGGARLGAANNAFGIHLGSLTGSGNLEINSPDTNHGGTILLAGPAAGYTATLTLARGTLKLAAPSFGGSLAAADGSRVFLDTLTTTGAAPAFGSHLTLGTAGGATVLVDPTATTPVTVSGNLSLGGSQTVFLTKPHSGVATPLLSYNGTLTGSATNLDLPGGIASYRAGTGFSVVAGSPNLVTLEMVSADRTWIAAGGDWNTNAETWATGTYANGDNVTFGDFDETSAAVTVNLASGTTVAPNSITFSNSAKSYTISGTGKITGTAAITKNGTGSAVISNTGGNDFAGGITVNDGSLYLVPSASLNVNRLTLTGGRLGATAALTLNANAGLSGSVTLGDSATGRTGGITVTGIHTVADGTTITVSNPVTAIFSGVTRLPASLTTATPFSTPNNGVLTFSGAIELSSDLAIDTTAAFNTSNFTNFNGSVNDGPASYKITKTGSGALRLSAPNNYDGGTDIEGGTIIAFHPAAFGSGPVTITNNGQANLGTGGTYPNAFSIRGLGQIVNGLSNTSPDGAIQLNTSNINLTGPITLTGDARIGGYLTTSNTILSGAISEDGNGPWLLEIGSPGAANGNGTITLTGTNTHTGGTKIQRVTLRAWGNDVFGTGQVEVNSGGSATLQNRLEINNSTIANDIVLDSNGRTHSTATTQTWGAITGYPGDNTTASTATVSGRIDILRSVANGGHFAAQGHPANSILRVTGEVTASSGVPVTVAFGTVQFAGGGDYADLHHYQGTLLLAAANGLCQNAILTQGHQGASVFDLNGFNQTLAALGQAGSGAATVTNHGAGAATLTLAPFSGATHTYPGTFVPGAAPLNLRVGGSASSVIALTGNSTAFTGTTTVGNGGILEINGTHGGTASQLVVESGGTLTGTGTIGGDVTLLPGARLRVNPTLGTLTIAGSLTVQGTATIEFIGTPGASNLIFTVTGAINASSFQFAIANPGNYNSPQFNLSGNQLILTTGVLNLTWTGSGGSTWNINSTSNWTDGTSSYKFLNGYAVNFTDSPGANQIISVGTTVQPSTVTFSNTNRSYTFEDLGDGKIQTNTLTKNGSGQVRFNLPLEVSGTMTLNAGATVLTSPDSAPSAADITATLAGGGTLELAAGYLNPLTLNADNSAFSGNLVVSREEVRIAGSAAAGTGLITLGSAETQPVDEPRLQLLSGVNLQNPVAVAPAVENAFIVGSGGLTGAASITKDGGGTLHLATVNSHQGATTIVNGTLRATAVGSLPASSTVVFGGPGSDQAATVLQLPAAMVADETVAAAPLSLNPAAADSTAILRKSSSGPLARITGQASLNGRSLHVAGGGVHLAGVIAGTGNLVIDLPAGEAVRISNSGNSFAGNIIVNGGSFRNAAADCIPDGAAVTLAAGATFEVGANEAVEQILGPATSTLRPSGGAVDLTVGASGSSFTYSGSLADNGINNVLNLNKAGSGTLTLDGTSTSAGRLRVQQGKVYVNGAIASRIEIAADAILAGTGTIHFNSQGAGLWPINGRIAPGRADAIGTFNLNNALSFQAGAGMDIRIADWSGAAPGTTHDLLLCPQMIFGGGNFVLRVDGTGMTGFTEAPRSFVIATATQQVFAPGINVQQFIATNFPGTGTWRITANGTNLLLNYTPPAGFGSWIGKYPSLTGDNALAGADPDSDGQDNLLEYVFDSAPDAAVPRHVPTGEVLAGNFVFTYRRNDLSLTDTSQTVQWSTDLQTWNDIPIPATSAGVVTIIGNDAEPDTVSVAIPRNGAPRITARLKVVQSEL